MNIKAIPYALVLLVGTSYAGHGTSAAISVLELASQSERFQGESVEVYGVICDGIETASVSLQPGTTCKHIAGINLQLGDAQPKPQLGSQVIVVGRFMDTSLASSGLLNY